MKKIILRIFIVLVIVGAAALLIFSHFRDKMKYNTGYVNGNTAGNLYNAGLFCEIDGTVFFANPDDDFKLYSMDPDGIHVKKICNDSVVYINADANYIYYIRNNQQSEVNFSSFTFENHSLCRLSREGNKITTLDSDPSMYPSLIGNEIYYLHYDKEDATTLYKINIDGSDKKQVMKNYAFPCSTQGQYFYYNGNTTDGNLYRFNTATQSSETIYTCSCYKPIISDGDIYYMDAAKDTAIVHLNPSTGETAVLTEGKVDAYNVSGSYIYYQTYGDHQGLYRVSTNGGEPEQLISGVYTNINIASGYIYFMDLNTKEMFYMPTGNPGQIQPFHPGKSD